jgi:hypothetical protein
LVSIRVYHTKRPLSIGFCKKNQKNFGKRTKIPFTKKLYYVIIYITTDFFRSRGAMLSKNL